MGQTEKLSKLGARHSKQLDAGLVEKASGDDLGDTSGDDAHLRLVKEDEEE